MDVAILVLHKSICYYFSLREKGEDEIHSDEEFDNYETIQRYVKSARHVLSFVFHEIMKRR